MENQIRITIWAFAQNEDQDFYAGSCFEEALYLKLKESKHYEIEQPQCELLLNSILNKENHPQDELCDLFHENVLIESNFATRLAIGDIIKPECFYSESEIGEAIINLLKDADFIFILRYREWSSTTDLELNFHVCHTDNNPKYE